MSIFEGYKKKKFFFLGEMEDVSGVFVDEDRPPVPIRRNASNISRDDAIPGQVEVIPAGVRLIVTFLLGNLR